MTVRLAVPLTLIDPTQRVTHPPKPRLTLRVAVSGHRPKPEKFPESSFDFVRRRLSDVFTAVDQTLASFRQKQPGSYEDGPHQVRLVSGLAEGADQLAIEVRPTDWQIDAILPFPLESYRFDFRLSATDKTTNALDQFDTSIRAAATVLQLPEDKQNHAKASNYNRARLVNRHTYSYAKDLDFLIRQFDILVTVWDGKAAEGPGGTAEIIRLALDAGIPVVWISSRSDIFPRLVEEVEEDGQPLAPPADCLRGSLQEAISTIVSVPGEPTDPSGHASHALSTTQRLQVFLSENWPDGSTWTTYDRLKRWMQGLPQRSRILPDNIEDIGSSWASFLDEAPAAGGLSDRLLQILLPRYAWADALAIDLSNRFRSAYIKAYLMAALAVVIALIGFFEHDFPGAIRQALVLKAILIAIEFYLIYRILRIVRTGRSARWQERWVEYRALAEILRDLRFLAYFGEYGFVQRPEDLEPASSAWFLWYLRATIRELGLPNALLDGAYQRALLVAVENNVVADQIKYHDDNARTLDKIHKFLYKAGEYFFLATLPILFLFLVVHLGVFVGMSITEGGSSLGSTTEPPSRAGSLLYSFGDIITFLVACLPALGAAAAGIRETGDFEGSAQRSQKTLGELQGLTRAFDAAKRRLRLDATSTVLLSTARVLTTDLAAWQAIYGRKRLNLPS